MKTAIQFLTASVQRLKTKEEMDLLDQLRGWLLLTSYIVAFMVICIGWYAYELLVLGHLNTNERDTYIALAASLFMMLPIADFSMKKMINRLNIDELPTPITNKSKGGM